MTSSFVLSRNAAFDDEGRNRSAGPTEAQTGIVLYEVSPSDEVRAQYLNDAARRMLRVSEDLPPPCPVTGLGLPEAVGVPYAQKLLSAAKSGRGFTLLQETAAAADGGVRSLRFVKVEPLRQGSDGPAVLLETSRDAASLSSPLGRRLGFRRQAADSLAGAVRWRRLRDGRHGRSLPRRSDRTRNRAPAERRTLSFLCAPRALRRKAGRGLFRPAASAGRKPSPLPRRLRERSRVEARLRHDLGLGSAAASPAGFDGAGIPTAVAAMASDQASARHNAKIIKAVASSTGSDISRTAVFKFIFASTANF